MTAAALLARLESAGVDLAADAEGLRYRGSRAVLSASVLADLKSHKGEILKLLRCPFGQLQAEWRAAVATTHSRFTKHDVEPDQDTLEAAALLEFEFASNWRPRRGVTEADARALLDAVYTGRMQGRLEDGRVILRPRYEQRAAGPSTQPTDQPQPPADCALA